MSHVQEWAEALSDSVSGVNVDLQKAITFDFNKDVDNLDHPYWKAATVIIEPLFYQVEVGDKYVEFMNDDMDNWVGFIRTKLGEDWGEIANIVRDIGY